MPGRCSRGSSGLASGYRGIDSHERSFTTPAVDKVTWYDYGQDLEANLRDPHARVHRGAYRARPSRRVYIPKANGRQRPLGVAGLEDTFSAKQKVELVLGRFVGPVDRGDLSRARHLRDAAAASA
jgi:hypothetical protein